MEFYITCGLLAAVIVLLVILLVRSGGKREKETAEKIAELKTGFAVLNDDIADLSGDVRTEFERSRRETSSSQAEMRKETSAAIGAVGEKMEKLRADNTESSAKLEKTVSESLNAIRINNLEQNQKQSRVISEAVEKMRESNEKKLEEMRVTVDEKLTSTLSTRLNSSFKTVSDRLESVYKSLGEMKELSTGVTTNVTALNRVLTNVKVRGTWAEVQLGSILDQTIPGMYETNFAPGSSGDRVEFAVRIPSSEGQITYLPIDSKFPMEDYVRLCDAADTADSEALAAARKALETRVLNEAKTVSKYINVPLTTPYAIMYLATEGLYAEIEASRSGISERIRSEYNVMLAGPSTITALLNSLSLGFRAVAVNEKANEVRELLGAAKQQYDKFGILIDKARKKIDDAGKSLDEAGRRNDIIRKKLGKAEEIDGMRADKLLGMPEDTETEE